MRLLYFGDMIVDVNENWRTIKDRLKDISSRYGYSSNVYKEFLKIAEYLKMLDFDDFI